MLSTPTCQQSCTAQEIDLHLVHFLPYLVTFLELYILRSLQLGRYSFVARNEMVVDVEILA